MQDTYGIITPSSLHFERHHAGVPDIDPAKHQLLIHGLVDQPLVYVNQAFVDLTGYPVEEILGRNCRFLQGPGTAREDVAVIRNAISNQDAVFSDLVNYRKDGTTFLNRLVLLPLEVGKRPHFIGMQIDSTTLLASRLASGKSFDRLKTSLAIKDRINTPLMTLQLALQLETASVRREELFQNAFAKILETVKALPFKE